MQQAASSRAPSFLWKKLPTKKFLNITDIVQKLCQTLTQKNKGGSRKESGAWQDNGNQSIYL